MKYKWHVYIYIYIKSLCLKLPNSIEMTRFFPKPACIIGIFQQHHVRREFGIHIALATKALDEACTLSPNKILNQQWLEVFKHKWIPYGSLDDTSDMYIYIHTDLFFLVDGDGIMIAACFLNKVLSFQWTKIRPTMASSITPPQADYRAACPSKVYVLQSSPNYFSFKKSRLWWKFQVPKTTKNSSKVHFPLEKI